MQKKSLDQLSNKELGQLFPITISQPNPAWKGLFSEEKKILNNLFNEDILKKIEHIGSTAVPGLIAKPTIDILLNIKKGKEKVVKTGLLNANYHFIHRPDNPIPHMMFVKGYSLNGYVGQAYHIHIRFEGDWDEIIFRDYLIKDPETCKAYAELKIKLASKYRNDREAYTSNKTGFINQVMHIARKEIGNEKERTF